MRKGSIIVVCVFLDESGTHAQSEVVSVAAVWAKISQWKSWEEQWNEKKRPIKVFHATDFFSAKGEFQGWSQVRRDKFAEITFPTIGDCGIRGKVAAFHKKNFRTCLDRRPDVLKFVKDTSGVRGNTDPYYLFAFQWALDATLRDLAETSSDISIVHEENDYQVEAHDFFHLTCKMSPGSMPFFGFASKDKYVPLQCADLLSHLGNRQFRSEQSDSLLKDFDLVDRTHTLFSFIKYDEAEVINAAERFISAWDANFGPTVASYPPK